MGGRKDATVAIEEGLTRQRRREGGASEVLETATAAREGGKGKTQWWRVKEIRGGDGSE